jgi:hypothetical protein
VRPDALGSFRLDDVEPGEYRLHVSNRRELLTYNQDLEITADLDLPLDIPTAAVQGTVRSAKTSRPLADALVSFQRIVGDGAPLGSITALSTDQTGTFTIDRLTAGSYRLTVTKDGYSPLELAVELAPGSTREDLDLGLSPTAGLELVVRFAPGLAAGPVTLAVLDRSGRPTIIETRLPGETGALRFPTVPPGTWELRVATPGSAPVSVLATVPGDPIPVELTAAAQLSIRIAELAESSLVTWVTLHAPDGRRFQTVDAAEGLREQWSLTAGAGTIAGVPAGVWTLRAAAPDGRTWERTVAIEGAGELSLTLE